jgi:AraC-like DNA-binding protein
MHSFPELSEERMALHRRALASAISSLQGEAARVHLPVRKGLWTRQSRQLFHGTPELFLQTHGSTLFDFPEEQFVARAGDITIVPKGLPHGERAEDGRHPFMETVVVLRDASFAFLLARRTAEHRVITAPADLITTASFDWIAETMELAVSAREQGEDTRSPYLRGLLLALLGRLWCDMQGARQQNDTAPPLIAQCRGLIEADFTNSKLSVHGLAARLECSADHLSRAFRSATGERMMDAINRRRITHAKALLLDVTRRISEVAWASGFESPTYFNRMFRRHTGATPREYRGSQVVS